MSPYLFSTSAAVIIVFFAVAAAFLFRQKQSDILARQYVWYLLACILWLTANLVADIANTWNVAYIASGLAFAGGSFIASYFLIFTHTFCTGLAPTMQRFWLYMSPGFIFSLLAYTPLSIKDVYVYPNAPSQVEPGIVYSISFFVLIGIIIYGLWQLQQQYWISDNRRRTQIVYISLGFLSVFVGQLVFTLALPLLGNLSYYNVAPQFTVFFALATGYAIFWHNLFEIRPFIQKGLIYSILLTTIVIIYITTVSLFAELYKNRTYTIIDTVIGIFSIIVALITVPKLDAWLRRITDPIFFSDRYEYAGAIHDLSKTLTQSTNLATLLPESEAALTRILRAEYVRVGNTPEHADDKLRITIPSNPPAYIAVGRKRSGTVYTTQDRLLLETFATQASVAFSRALLFQDVQDRAVQLERRVAARTKELQDVQESQRVIMLQLSHNLQTPLAILINSLETLKATVPGIDFTSLERAVHDVSGYITRLLRLARLESHQEPSDINRFSLSDLLIDIVEEVSIIASSTDHVIAAEITAHQYVEADKTHIREAVLNILSNALKYSEHASTIKVTLKANKHTAIIRCHNIGSYISPVDREAIFTPFYRNNEHKTISGTGLGLAIAKQMIERYDGTLKVVSTKNTGTTFTITLPRIIPAINDK